MIDDDNGCGSVGWGREGGGDDDDEFDEIDEVDEHADDGIMLPSKYWPVLPSSDVKWDFAIVGVLL